MNELEKIILRDEYGNKSSFEVLDLIEYKGGDE